MSQMTLEWTDGEGGVTHWASRSAGANSDWVRTNWAHCEFTTTIAAHSVIVELLTIPTRRRDHRLHTVHQRQATAPVVSASLAAARGRDPDTRTDSSDWSLGNWQTTTDSLTTLRCTCTTLEIRGNFSTFYNRSWPLAHCALLCYSRAWRQRPCDVRGFLKPHTLHQSTSEFIRSVHKGFKE